MTKEETRKLVLAHSAQRVADAVGLALGTHFGRSGTEDEKYGYVVGHVREAVTVLMPEHEERAREIFSLVQWPTGFGPVPAFERVMGIVCGTCGGTGVSGFISTLRCPDC